MAGLQGIGHIQPPTPPRTLRGPGYKVNIIFLGHAANNPERAK